MSISAASDTFKDKLKMVSTEALSSSLSSPLFNIKNSFKEETNFRHNESPSSLMGSRMTLGLSSEIQQKRMGNIQPYGIHQHNHHQNHHQQQQHLLSSIHSHSPQIQSQPQYLQSYLNNYRNGAPVISNSNSTWHARDLQTVVPTTTVKDCRSAVPLGQERTWIHQREREHEPLLIQQMNRLRDDDLGLETTNTGEIASGLNLKNKILFPF